MGTRMFAAIDVGSYELNMKIFEFSTSNQMKEVDSIRYRLDLGTDTFSTGKISTDKKNELCKILYEFTEIMKAYRVTHYKAYGTSAIRETENTKILLDQIEQRSGIKIEVLSNSEQRFLNYKSIASKGEDFDRIIEKGTAIVDIGGGSIQISLFDKDKLVATQNMKLGVLRLQDDLQRLAIKPSKVDALLDEMISVQLNEFERLYLKDRQIENIIIVDDYVSMLIQNRIFGLKRPGYIETTEYENIYKKMKSDSSEWFKKQFQVTDEKLVLVNIAANLIRKAFKMMNARMIWAPGVVLCDGIAYEYGENKKLITCKHDFEEDIVACAWNISKRYSGNRKRNEKLEKIALSIYDSMKKIHGLTNRDRLLLRIATILNDCGKYINIYNLGICSYNIIMATEIIGLSHEEREIVANVVKFNHLEFEYYNQIAKESVIDVDAYMRITKLTAILRVANRLNCSPRQKFGEITVRLHEDELVTTIMTDEDITFEKGLLKKSAIFFEEVFSIHPIIKQKKSL